MLFGDWYRTYGSDKNGWPHVTFYFDDGQDGGRVSGGHLAGGRGSHVPLPIRTDRRQEVAGCDEASSADRTMELLEKGDTESTGAAYHHGMRGNDDFCSTVLLACLAAVQGSQVPGAVRQEHQHC